jgi:hypothetical protein
VKACITLAALAGLYGGQFDQHHQTAGALHQGAHGAGVGCSFDPVALPVAGELAVFYLGPAQVNAEYLGDLSPAIWPLVARHLFVAGMAQGSDELTLELTHGLGIDAVVDALV